MDKNRDNDIDVLLQRMKKDNENFKRRSGSFKALSGEDSDEDSFIESRYKEKKNSDVGLNFKSPDVKGKKNVQRKQKSEKKKEEKQKNEIMKKKNLAKKSKKNKEVKEDGNIKKEVSKSPSTYSRNLKYSAKRPKTAIICTTGVFPGKKSDKLALFKSWEAVWSTSNFICSNRLSDREGRKLDLVSRFKKKQFETKKKTDTVKLIKNDFVPPNEKRRDDLRFNTRMKMMSL
jgi:hypothetical protein